MSLFKRKNIHLVTQVVLHTQGHMGRERVKSSAINWLGSISWSLNPTRWLPHTNLMQDRSPGSTLMSHISHCRGKAGLHRHHAHAACMLYIALSHTGRTFHSCDLTWLSCARARRDDPSMIDRRPWWRGGDDDSPPVRVPRAGAVSYTSPYG